VDWLLFQRRVLTLRFTSEFQEQELGSALDTVTRLTGTIMAIRGTMGGITHPVTTGIIHTERITIVDPRTIGTTGIEFTIATIAIIITTAAIKLT
jgi:hypothetical protein